MEAVLCPLQDKYECAQNQSNLKVVSPDWILDSVDSGVRLEEERYHPSCLKKLAEMESSLVSAEACNGSVPSSEAASMPQQPAHEHPKTNSKPPTTQLGPPVVTTPPSAGGEPSLWHVKYSHAVNMEPMYSARPAEAAQPERRVSEEETPGAVAVKSEQLLDRVVIYFTDYQDCVEDDTLEKWKLVSIRQSSSPRCRVCGHVRGMCQLFFSPSGGVATWRRGVRPL